MSSVCCRPLRGFVVVEYLAAKRCSAHIADSKQLVLFPTTGLIFLEHVGGSILGCDWVSAVEGVNAVRLQALLVISFERDVETHHEV